jgi:hypothetical protein
MSQSRKPIHEYPKYIPFESDKYLPSIVFDIRFENQTLKANVRPLVKDKGYYSVSIESIFLGHIHRNGDVWMDFIGTSNELYQVIGKSIEEHVKKEEM